MNKIDNGRTNNNKPTREKTTNKYEQNTKINELILHEKQPKKLQKTGTTTQQWGLAQSC